MAKKKKTTPPASPTMDHLTFEDAMSNLESIIDRIETGEIGLQESLGEYERGVALIKRCRTVLQEAEQRVEKLRLPSETENASLPGASADETGGGVSDPDAPTEDLPY